MIELHPEFLIKNGKKEFAVLKNELKKCVEKARTPSS